MTPKSMTGFGKGSVQRGNLLVEVEASSLNRKQLDVRLGLPGMFAAIEPLVVKAVSRSVSRGAVTVTVRVSGERIANESSLVDRKLAAACVHTLRKTARGLGLADDLSAKDLLSMPDVLRTNAPSMSSRAAWSIIEPALTRALAGLITMRTREGKALARDLKARCGRMKAILDRVKALAPRAEERQRKVLLAKLKAAGISTRGCDEALAREIVLFAARCDFTEECTRLSSHMAQMEKMLASDREAGRSLDFLIQEMLREVNTIGSKANSAAVSKNVVMFKAELDRVREQVQNLE